MEKKDIGWGVLADRESVTQNPIKSLPGTGHVLWSGSGAAGDHDGGQRTCVTALIGHRVAEIELSFARQPHRTTPFPEQGSMERDDRRREYLRQDVNSRR